MFRDHIAKGNVLIYMDDLIIPSRTEKEGANKLSEVLLTASEHGLNINWKKCRFLEKKLSIWDILSRADHLGHRQKFSKTNVL